MEIAVLIPAYQPDSVLISLVQALHRENFRLIVTDDGSGPAYADIFSALLPYAEVLTCPENRGKGFVYWEPAWLPVPGCGWANEAALAYTGEQGPGGNEWANQALFDYDGNALPALKTIRDFGCDFD